MNNSQTPPLHRIQLISSLRERGVRSLEILKAVETTPREMFAPQSLASQIPANKPLPLPSGAVLQTPLLNALILQELNPDARLHKILEIAPGTGYLTALLCRLYRRVFVVSRDKLQLEDLEQRLLRIQCTNLAVHVSDPLLGQHEQAPFHAVVVNAATHEFPNHLLQMLHPDGILVAAVVSPPPDAPEPDPPCSKDAPHTLLIAKRIGDNPSFIRAFSSRFPVLAAPQA